MSAHSTRDSRASRGNRSLRAGGLLLAFISVAAACGKKGPPLAPFVRLPATVGTVTAQRIGNDVFLSFAVPSTNIDGQQPADIGALEVYAVTSTQPPATEDQREVAALIATVPVRPILPELPPINGSAPPPTPLPPGVDRGATAVVRETLTSEAMLPVELPPDPRARIDRAAEPDDEGFAPLGPLVAPPPTQFARRHYFVVGVSTRGRKSDPSTPVSVPLESVTSAPGAPKVEYTETQLTVRWPPSPDARTSTFVVPVPVKPTGNTSPSTVKPVVPLAPLPARSLGFSTEATAYHLYDVPANASPANPTDPYAVTLPAPLTPQPVLVTEFVIPSVAFGVERCFEVRPVDNVGQDTVIGPASPRTCVTPVDSFAPAAPRSLAAIAGTGSINLIWDANTEPDIAGYLVLRAEAPGDTLQPVTPQPVAAATYRDESVRLGVRYVYAVVAVDRAGNRSAESNRQEETAR